MTIKLFALVMTSIPSDEKTTSARYSGASSCSRRRYATDTRSAIADAITTMIPRNTPNPSTRTMPAIVVIGPSSRTCTHCHASVPAAARIPAAATMNPAIVDPGRRRITARIITMTSAAPAREISGAIASQSTDGVPIESVTAIISRRPRCSGARSRYPAAWARGSRSSSRGR
jgi:hypothetical protein